MLSETSNKIPIRIEYMRIFLKERPNEFTLKVSIEKLIEKRLSEWEARKILKILRMLKMHKMLKMLEMLKWLKMSKKHNTYKIRKKEAKEKKDGPKRDFYFFMIRVLLIGSM